LYDAALSPEELSGFVAHLFDREVLTARLSSVPTPFSSDNPPPLVRILDFFKFIIDSCSYESILLIHHDGQDNPKGNDDGGQKAPSSESIVPNLTGSGPVAQVCPSAAD
jgi:hypothetical protein